MVGERGREGGRERGKAGEGGREGGGRGNMVDKDSKKGRNIYV